MTARSLGATLVALALSAAPTRADPALDALVAAYPDHLTGHEGNELIWKDNTRMPTSRSPPSTKTLAASATNDFLSRCTAIVARTRCASASVR